MFKKPFALLLASAAMLVSTSALAQSYDDDDIYFNPAKATKETKTVKKTVPATNVQNTYQYKQYQSTDYPSADSYTPAPTAGVNRSVDEYNRRGIFASEQPAASAADSLQTDDFQATRQIEKFYNPDIIVAANDDQLTQYYYSQPASTVNIIVNTPYSYYWDYPYYTGYWGNPYRPWNWGWGPSWNWAWSPSWGWNWGWSWSWGSSWTWGNTWGWGPSWGGWTPSWGWVNPRPGSVGNIRPGNAGYRPGTTHAGASNVRPGSSAGNWRPGNANTSGYRPGNVTTGNDGYRPGRGNTRGNASNSNAQTGTYRPNNNSNNNNNHNNSGYRPSSSGNSSWGSSGGGFRGGSSSGGVRGGGGGRGRH